MGITQRQQVSKSTDIARFLGASAIFYYHVGILTGYPLSQWGEYAVTLFIVLAGIAYACFSSIQPADLRSYSRYFGHRLIAIFPTFVAVNCIIFAASYVYPSALNRPFTLAEFGLSSAGLSQYFDRRYLSVPMWFVPLILQTYLVFPIIDNLTKRVSPVLIIVAAFLISLALTSVVFWRWPSHGSEICRNWSVIFRLPEACVAVIAGRWILRRRDFQPGIIAVVAFLLVSFLLAIISPRFPAEAYILSLPWHGALVTVVLLVPAICIGIFTSLPDSQLRLIGGSSFPFFLAHGTGILFVYHRFKAPIIPWIVYFALCWGGAILFTFVFNCAQDLIRIRFLASTQPKN